MQPIGIYRKYAFMRIYSIYLGSYSVVMESKQKKVSPIPPHELLLSTAVGLAYGLGAALLILLSVVMTIDQSSLPEVLSVLLGTDLIG